MTVKDLISSAMCDVYINVARDGNGDIERPHICVKAICEGYADGILSDALLNADVCLIAVHDDAMYVDLQLEEDD